MTWEDRDFPVLEAIVTLTDEGAHHIEPEHLAKRTGLGEDSVNRALVALAGENPPFFQFTDTTTFDSKGREIGFVYNPTGHARRTVGTWPTPESLADRIVEGLHQAAAEEDDETQRGKIKRTAEWLGGTGRQILVQAVGTVIAKSTGI